MRRKVKNEDSKPLNQTQATSVNSTCHKGIQRNAFLLQYIYNNVYVRDYSFEAMTFIISLFN